MPDTDASPSTTTPVKSGSPGSASRRWLRPRGLLALAMANLVQNRGNHTALHDRVPLDLSL